MTNKSEFGKGLCYNLGLFLAHTRWNLDIKDELKPELWFNVSSDHLYELVIPETLPTKLQNRLKKFQSKCLNWGHGFPTKESERATEKDYNWSIQEAKDLLRLIDNFNGVKTIKGDWE